MDVAFRRPDYIVAVGKEASDIGGGVGDNAENVPDVFSGGKGSPLESKA